MRASQCDLADGVRARLRAQADPARAAGQQGYMKSALPFLGVTVPTVRRTVREQARGIADAEELRAAAAMLWRDATHREHWYAALAVLGLRALRADPRTIPLLEDAVRSAAWWDVTDECAHRVADLLDERPEQSRRLVLSWRSDPDRWLRRLAIIAQLGRRERIDLELLADAIEPNVADTDFFIRKAVGWALRDCARTHPEWVRGFVDTHDLSPLSRREALKHLD